MPATTAAVAPQVSDVSKTSSYLNLERGVDSTPTSGLAETSGALALLEASNIAPKPGMLIFQTQWGACRPCAAALPRPVRCCWGWLRLRRSPRLLRRSAALAPAACRRAAGMRASLLSISAASYCARARSLKLTVREMDASKAGRLAHLADVPPLHLSEARRWRCCCCAGTASPACALPLREL